jgi:hypothetical protein
MHNQLKDLNLSSWNSSPHPAVFPLGSAESRAAARTMLLRKPITIVDFGTLPLPLPSYEELLREWKDEGDRYTHEQRRDNTLFMCAIPKDSEDFRSITEGSAK